MASDQRIQWRPLRAWSRAESDRLEPWSELAAELITDGVESTQPAAALWVPGRIELFGKHTDYAGGRSLVMAVDRGMRMIVAPRADSQVRWRDMGRAVNAEFDLLDPGRAPGNWSNYLRTPARRVAADFGALRRGVDVAMRSDLPAAAGLSSSSALLVGASLCFAAAQGEALPGLGRRERLAAYLGAVENGHPFEGSAGGDGVGTFGGSEDQTAILCSAVGSVLLARFAPLTIERRIAWPDGWRLAVAVSGVHAKKTGGAQEVFNRLATRAAAAVEAFRAAGGGEVSDLGAALDLAGDAEALEVAVRAGASAAESDELARRARQFGLESGQWVPQAATALEATDSVSLGRVAAMSHGAADELLGNQIPATNSLVRLARQHGAAAASAFGGGFGGAVWALTAVTEAEAFLDRWLSAYTADFPDNADQSSFFITAPAAGAGWLELEETDREATR